MPTIQRPTREHRLADLLVRHFATPHPAAPPFIIENTLPGGRSRHLLVIWDEWADLDRSKRSRIILDAYECALPLQSAAVTVAVGLSLSEALSMGYLPYKIEALVRNGDRISAPRLRTALESAGGALVKIGKQTQLRFPTLELAQEAYRTLQNQVPGPFWTITQETPPEGA